MPELAEVEYYRRQWSAGVGQRVVAIHLHPEKRIFRGSDIGLIRQITGQKLKGSEAAGKQMLFRTSGEIWLGLHLGMTGRLSLGPATYTPGKHDHLVLFQTKQALIFTDARQFGRVLVHCGKEAPEWWAGIAPAVTASAFTLPLLAAFLDRHARLSVKPTLLLQDGFPGVGNWMADEILWRAAIAPKRACSTLSANERKALWREVRFVARHALRTISAEFDDPPRGWLFHERWKGGGICPKHRAPLKRETIGGRTTAWCSQCQR